MSSFRLIALWSSFIAPKNSSIYLPIRSCSEVNASNYSCETLPIGALELLVLLFEAI